MRTTVEIDDEHRARLLEIAARRGEKGFSKIVSEAIAQYLATLDSCEAERLEVLKLRGSMSRKDTERLRADTIAIRQHWR